MTTRAANASPTRMSCGFSSDPFVKSGSTRLKNGRVPAVVVSPRARRGHVSHVVYDQTSILRFIETKWNLPALTARDAHAADLLDCLDLHGRPAFLHPPTLPAPALQPSSLPARPLDPSALPVGAPIGPP